MKSWGVKAEKGGVVARADRNIHINPRGTFQVRVKVAGKTNVIGTFVTIDDATACRDAFEGGAVGAPEYGPLTEIETLRARYVYEPQTGIFRYRTPSRRVAVGEVAGSENRAGYRSIKGPRKSYQAHRAAWAIHYGAWPEGLIDHINGNRADNRISNLREVDHLRNAWNRSPRKNSTGFPGVVAQKYAGGRIKYFAQFRVDRTRYSDGPHDDPKDAHAAYEQLRRQHFGEFARD